MLTREIGRSIRADAGDPRLHSEPRVGQIRRDPERRARQRLVLRRVLD